ncbi:peptide chain release factor 2 [bacterium G20]|nr:peptide chain release factor 2 [bacterium G20]
MEDLKKQLAKLQLEHDSAISQLKLDRLKAKLKDLEVSSEDTNFWSNKLHAQAVMRNIAQSKTRIERWEQIDRQIRGLQDQEILRDESLMKDLSQELQVIKAKLEELKKDLQFEGPFDDHDVIVSVYAGAGGTDAQDWAQMLLRMYVRWAESHKLKVETIEQSVGEEAGIKSAMTKISKGDFLYGKLAGEHGVHRLVRLSPFNADNLRQTSFAKVETMPSIDKPSEVQLDEKDLKIDVYRAGGHGGQSVNTTDSAVRVTHIPTGISVAIQNERSQLQNKETALGILRSKLVQLQLEQHAENLAQLKGPNQSAEWGNQIRSYVLHPYKQVKDLRTGYETTEPDKVLDGNLDPFIDAWLEKL